MLIPKLTEEEIKSKSVNKSVGEYLVLDKLKSIARERNWIILRSLRLENNTNEHKIEGEIDIVIFTENQGIILLEVKSSDLRVLDGKWEIFNRGSNSWIPTQDPLEQSKDSYFSFKEETKDLFKLTNVNPLVSWGCIFPECTGFDGTISYPSWRLCLADKFDELELFLDKLVKRELNKLSNSKRRAHRSMEISTINNILEEIAPIRLKSKYISSDYNESLLEIDKESEMLNNLVKVGAGNPFVFIEGPAGTGKTKSAIYESKYLSSQQKRFLFLCKSPQLANHISKWLVKDLENTKSKVCSTQDLEFSEVDTSYDAIIIDEAQDLVHLNEIKDLILSYYSHGKYVRIYGDFEFQNFYHTKNEFYQWLEDKNIVSTKNKLNLNLRNTTQIGSKIKRIAQFDNSRFSLNSINGENIRYEVNIISSDLYEKINHWIQEWNQRDYPSDSISVLFYNKEINSDLKSNLSNLGVGVTDVISFKGLESPYVILVVDKIDSLWETMLYVGISRARIKCDIIFTENLSPEVLKNIIIRLTDARL